MEDGEWEMNGHLPPGPIVRMTGQEGEGWWGRGCGGTQLKSEWAREWEGQTGERGMGRGKECRMGDVFVSW